jgi:hypothetical protein
VSFVNFVVCPARSLTAIEVVSESALQRGEINRVHGAGAREIELARKHGHSTLVPVLEKAPSTP